MAAAIGITAGSLTIKNSTISETRPAARAGGGGGVFFIGTIGAGGLTITNSTFASNTATLSGGGFHST